MLGVGYRDYGCKKCGNRVCGPCSSTKRYLSKNATEKLRVCDLCDTKMDNVQLRNQFDKFLALKQKKKDVMSRVIETRQQHVDKEEQKAKEHEEALRAELEELKAKVATEERNEKHFID